MCRVPVQLRELVKQRLAAAAEEIIELVEKTITEYEEHLVSKYEKQRQQGVLFTPDLGVGPVGAVEGPCAPPHIKEEQEFIRAQFCSILRTDKLLPSPAWSISPGPIPTQPELTPEILDFAAVQTLSGQGPLKEGPVLMSITLKPVKEEPAPAALDTPLESSDELLKRHASLLFIKQEETEQKITVPHATPLGRNQNHSQDREQNQDQYPERRLNQNKIQDREQSQDLIPSPDQEEQNLDQDLHQHKDQGLNQHFDEEDNGEWEFEGLRSSRPSPDETENSSEDEEGFPPDNPPKLLRIQEHLIQNLGQRSATVPTNETDDEATENSSDLSDSEAMSARACPRVNKDARSSDCVAPTKELRIVSNNMIKTLKFTARAEAQKDPVAALRRKQKRKDRRKAKSGQNPEEAQSIHVCPVCKRTFDTRIKMTAHMKTHGESLPCPTCGKAFKIKGYLLRHMKKHQSKTPSQETAVKAGTKRKAEQNLKRPTSKKKSKVNEGGDTDPDQTENSSDEN